MNTYFIRHTRKLEIDAETAERIWNENYITIHYPKDVRNDISTGDSTSIDPDDYNGKDRSSMRTINNLCKSGGYIFSVYWNKAGGKIGFVNPGSKIELLKGVWRDNSKYAGRDAILKAVKLDRVRNLSASECISLTSVQPRLGTIVQWHKVGERVKFLLEGVMEPTVGSLTPDLQEVMCMEFLRSDKTKKYSLPKLEYTLAPVGRTMKDVDIVGATSEGKLIYAQVTFSRLESAGWKLAKLDAYSAENQYTILFCRCDSPSIDKSHIIFPIELVFEEFCLKSENGINWFRNIK